LKFELTILGSGSAVPTLKRNPTAQYLNIAENYFLIDCGEGTQLQIRKFGCKMQRIDNIFISHLHGDHYLGLPGLLQTMHMLGRTKPLYIHCPGELENLLTAHFLIANSKGLNFEIHYKATQTESAELLFSNSHVEVFSIPLKHKIPTTGFLFKEKPKPLAFKGEMRKAYNIPNYWIPRIKAGEDFIEEETGKVISSKLLTVEPSPPKTYAYCSDTAYYPEIVEQIKGADLLYHEATFLNDKIDRARATLHSTARQAAEIANTAKVKQLVLGHFSARYPIVDAFLEEAAPYFKNTILAEDGMKIEL
jgi:ribonuclease Z